MKKPVFLSMIILALVAGFAANATNPQPKPEAYIHYQVNISNHLPAGQTACPSRVMITDGNGSAVNGLQPYDPAITSYHFYELGPVTGTRAAVMVNVPMNADIFCPFLPQPVLKNTTFVNGRTYKYPMFYGTQPPSPLPMPVPAR